MKLEKLLLTRGLVQQSPSIEVIRQRAEVVKPQPMKLFYGETFDEEGNTLDSMKYYFFVDALSKALTEEGFETVPEILIADTAACRNVGEKLERRYMSLGTDRVNFVKKINEVYGLDLKIIRMSDYIDSIEFIKKREQVIDMCQADPELMAAIEKSVPESKLDIERKKGFLYSFDEITTIIDLDIKVGPPREDLYDNIARQVSSKNKTKELISLFLTPSFPLGMNWAYFFSNEGIEDHGITAYKAGSKRLQRNRVIVGRSNPQYIQNMIDASFISADPALPNSVLEAGMIAEMARKKLEKDDSPITLAQDFYEGRINSEQLKKVVGKNIDEHVLRYF